MRTFEDAHDHCAEIGLETMPEPNPLKIEDALDEAEMKILDQWATSVSQGARNHEVIFNATYVVLAKLWNNFDPDVVDAWCDSLVAAKLAAARKK